MTAKRTAPGRYELWFYPNARPIWLMGAFAALANAARPKKGKRAKTVKITFRHRPFNR